LDNLHPAGEEHKKRHARIAGFEKNFAGRDAPELAAGANAIDLGGI
jgi:hypothetical protein